jgi:glycosyltransferase involved in cell wall biosynthesis
MRILHLDFDDLEQPWGGGQARRTYEVNRQLAAERGWQIMVVTGSYSGARPREVAVGAGRLRYRRAGGGPFPLNVLTFLASFPLLARRYGHDLLVEDFTTPVGPGLAPRWTDRPAIGSAQFLFADQMARKYRLPFDRLERAALASGGYRHLVALAESGAARLRAAAPQAEVRVIPQGVNTEDFVPEGEIDGGGEHVLYLGRLDVDQKGLDVLLAAWARLRPEERPELLVAGGGREQVAVARLILELRLEGSVRLMGVVRGEEKRRLLRGARFLVMPSRYETFGISAVEALAAGKPVVASRVAGLEEAAQGGAVWVPPGDAPALAAAVRQLWADADQRRALGRAGREAVSDLTWDRVAREQGTYYEKVVG